MKNPVITVFLAAIALSSFGQNTDRAWVRVKTDYGMGARIDTLHFVLTDGYTSQTIYSVADENGVFLAGFDVSNSIDILWGYRNNITLPLIITPNDTIQITILSEKDGVLFGKRARTCANLMEIYDKKNRPRVQALESEYTSDARDFVDLMTERLNSHLRFVNSFCKSTKCTKTFVTWYIKSAYVSYYRNLADYCHSFQRRAMEDPSQLNEFLRAREVIVHNIDLNDETLEMSSGYYDLLKSIFSLYVTPQELRRMYYTKASHLLLQKQNLAEGETRALERIQLGSFTGGDLDVFTRLSHKYKRDINPAVWNSIDPSVRQKLGEIQDDDVRKVIFAYYKGIRNWI